MCVRVYVTCVCERESIVCLGLLIFGAFVRVCVRARLCVCVRVYVHVCVYILARVQADRPSNLF